MLSEKEKEVFVRLIKEKIKQINNLQVIKLLPSDDSAIWQVSNNDKN